MKFSTAVCLLVSLATTGASEHHANVRRRDEIVVSERSSSSYINGLHVKSQDIRDQPRAKSIPFDPPRSINRKNPHIQPRETDDYKVSGAQTRIVGGSQVENENDYPWFVFWDIGCGGSLILPDVVLTAAHCNSSNKNVVVGSFDLSSTKDGEAMQWVSKKKHPNYNDNTLENDFLLLKLEKPAANTPVRINSNDSEPDNGDPLTVIGHGSTRSGGSLSSALMYADVETISNCGQYSNNEIEDSVMFCAGIPSVGGIDSCQGDSGGPIFSGSGSNAVQMGVVSWGYGCAVAGYPGVYARISGVYDWIKTEACNLSSVGGELCGGSNPTPAPQPAPTPAPQPAPVPAPVPAPSPSPPTGGDCIDLVVTLTTDRNPWQNYWFILDADTFDIIEYIDGFTKQKTTYEITHCVPADGCVYFDFYDEFCNGLGKAGNLNLVFDGDELYNGRKFGCGIEGFIGYGC